MKVAIVGYATEGITSAAYWHNKGAEITVCDQDASLEVPEAYKKQLGAAYLDNLDLFDIVVRSAGIHPRILLDKNPSIGSKITTNIEEFMRVCPTKNIIGVTGTKGKGTTSTLITKMLESAGYIAYLLGNIGQPPLEVVQNIRVEDWVVLEISSFQLEDFKGPSPHLAVCLMVVPEHLNWHSDMQEYMQAKSNLFRHQSEHDYAIYFEESDNSKQITNISLGTKISYFSDRGAHIHGEYIEIEGVEICKISDVKLLGAHNLQNVCAAVTTVWQITPDVEAIASVVKSFGGLEHRIEFVRDLDGVKYYDDSFATTPETSIAAIRAFNQPKVIIVGGSDKGIPLDPLADEIAKSNVRHAVVIGDMAPTIEKLLLDRGFTNITLNLATITDIVEACKKEAHEGDVVLLSTGCASFGLFKDYKDRGNQFKRAVLALS